MKQPIITEHSHGVFDEEESTFTITELGKTLDIVRNENTIYLINVSEGMFYTSNPNNLFYELIPSGNYVNASTTQRIVVTGETWIVQNSSDGGNTWVDAHVTQWQGESCGIVPGTNKTALFVGYQDDDEIEGLGGPYNDQLKTITIESEVFTLQHSFTYGKTYSQTLNTEYGQLTANLQVVEGKNRAILEMKMVQGNTVDYGVNLVKNYTYNEGTKVLTVSSDNSLTYNPNNNTFSYNYYGVFEFDSMGETNNSVGEWYTVANAPDSDLGVYTGIYYNSEVKKHIKIEHEVGSGNDVYSISGDEYSLTYSSTSPSVLNNQGVYKDGNNANKITYDGKTYTLLTDLTH